MRLFVKICSTTFFLLVSLHLYSQKQEGPYVVVSWHGKITYGMDSIPLKKFDTIKSKEALHFSTSLDEVMALDALGNKTAIYPYKEATEKRSVLSVILDKFFSATRERFSSRGDDFEVVQLFIREDALIRTDTLRVSQKAYASKTPYYISWESSTGERQIRETFPYEGTYITMDNALFGDTLAQTAHNSYGKLGYRENQEESVTYFTEIYVQFCHLKIIQEELNFLKQQFKTNGLDMNHSKIELTRFIEEYYGEAITLEDFKLD